MKGLKKAREDVMRLKVEGGGQTMKADNVRRRPKVFGGGQ